MSQLTDTSRSELQETNGGFIGLAFLAVRAVAYVAASTAVRTAVVSTIKYVGTGITVGTVAGYTYNKVNGK